MVHHSQSEIGNGLTYSPRLFCFRLRARLGTFEALRELGLLIHASSINLCLGQSNNISKITSLQLSPFRVGPFSLCSD